MKWLRRFLSVLAATTLVVLGWAGTAAAHDPGTSVIEVRPTETGFEVQVDLPIDELGEAIGQSIATDLFGLSQMRGEIVGYVDTELNITDTTGIDLPVQIGTINVIRSDGRLYVRVMLDSDSVATKRIDSFVIVSTLIIENDDTHKIVITSIDDDGSARIAGILDDETDDLTVSFNDNAEDASFGSILRLGFDHVLDGADHLLFMLTLLLPAPLVASAGRWRSEPGAWRALKRVVHVATAFTCGHSISLAAVALGVFSLPTRPVEIVIAVSVAVSATHAFRPLTVRGEIPIAAGFGLVHGIAFAEILASYGLVGTNTLRTLLAFNLGVEAAQIAMIVVAFPSLWLLSRTRAYPVVRVSGAGIAFLLACGWIIERIAQTSNPLSFVEDWTVGHLPLLAIALAAIAVTAWWHHRCRVKDL